MGIQTRPFLRHPQTLAAALAAASLFAASWPALAADSPAPVPGTATRTSGAAAVPVIAVARSGTASSLELDGSIQPLRQATVASQVGGNVLQLAVKAGDRVKAGQLVARVDSREATAALQRSDAALAQAQAEATNARLNAERTRDLRSKGFVSQSALDIAENQWRGAQAGVEQAQAGRAQAALARGFSSVTAPFDGIVGATHLDAGDLATPGRPIATIYAPGALRAVVQVGVSRAELLRSAQRVQVVLPDGRAITPLRSTELATADAVSQTIEWRLDLPADVQASVRPGQMVQVRLDGAAPKAGADSVIVVPQAAVLRRGELNAVYVVQGDQFVLRAVRLGAERGAEGVAVVAGLKPGERIAADALRAGLADARPAR
jgi:RND family efflux transporter MFP subunit